MSISLYTAYHKSAPLLASASVRPIHVGGSEAEAYPPRFDIPDWLARSEAWKATHCC